MAKKANKVIVTNKGVLRTKYGTGAAKIEDGVRKLIAADATRGLTTRLVALDDAKAMSALKAKPVKDAADEKQNKVAIDGVYRALQPDYLVILGAIDVIPHQDLKNPLYSKDDDDDRCAWGDLPYACEAPYSREIGDFRGPSRVVGRIPDLPGGTDPAYVVRLLRTAAGHRTRPRSDYDKHLGVSAKVWEKSTRLSLKELFGTASDLQISPPKGPSWPKTSLARRTHFINCHGAEADPFFYGEWDDEFPPAHSSAKLTGRISDGTVVAAECCYGGELYDPEGGQKGICSEYLAGGAYGVFGSSTIAYGPADTNGSADLICQYFLKHVLSGASLGRATLEARQQFVERVTLLDPVDLKTLGQFSLLGDPSIHAVATVKSTAASTKAFKATVRALPPTPIGRTLRRERLLRRGLALPTIVATVRKKTSAAPPKMKAMLASAAKETRLKDVRFASFSARPLASGMSKSAKAMAGGKADVYIAIGTPTNGMNADPPARGARAKTARPGADVRSKIARPVVLSAVVKNGEVVRLRKLYGK